MLSFLLIPLQVGPKIVISVCAMILYVFPAALGSLLFSIIYTLLRIPYHIKEARRRARAKLYRDAYAIICGEYDFSQHHYKPTPKEDAFWADVEAVLSGEMFERYRVYSD